MSKKPSYILWGLFTALVVIAKWNTLPSSGNVFNIYRTSGEKWLLAEQVYESGRFLYLPFVASIFSFISYLSFEIGGALWRIINITIFFLGIHNLYSQTFKKNSEIFFLIVSIVSIAISWSAARHAQMTLAMAGIMMLATVALQNKKWTLAGFFLALAVSLKPLAIVLLLVAVVIYPRTIPSTFLSILSLLAFPFLLQENQFVFQQYANFPEVLKEQALRAQDFPFIQAEWTLRKMGIYLSLSQQFFMRIFFALITLFACFKIRKAEKNTEALYIFIATTVYILLMGTGTEANTYAMISPALGILIAYNWQHDKKTAAILFSIIFLGFISSKAFAKSYPETILTMIKPIMSFSIVVILSSQLYFIKKAGMK